MDRHDFGFAFTLVLLLIAPVVPIGVSGVSPAGFGLVLWFCLSSRLPLLMFRRLPSLLGLIGFAFYVALVSLASIRPGAIAYAFQFGFYSLLSAMLFPAYLCDPDRRRRAWTLLAIVGGVYCLALVVSLWTGPAYRWQINTIHKAYHGHLIMRGIGLAEGANSAGGVAAVLACFAMFAYRPGGHLPLVLIAISIASVLATMSRGALAAFVVSLTIMALLVIMRPLTGAPMARRGPILRFGTVTAVCVVVPIMTAIVIPSLNNVVMTADRMLLDDEYRAKDVSMRLNKWQQGVDQWVHRRSVPAKLFGAGFRSGGFTESKGIYRTSHNAYVEMLLDFGAIGLMLFGALLIVTIARFGRGIMLRPGRRVLTFAFSGMLVLVVHNASQVFFWTPTIAVMMVLLLSCGELALLERRHGVSGHLNPRFVRGKRPALRSTARDLIPCYPHAAVRRESLR